MSDEQDELKALDSATRKYRQTEAAHEKARGEAVTAVVAALRADVPPTVVAARSPFTAAHVRTIAREHGIPPARPGLKPRKR